VGECKHYDTLFNDDITGMQAYADALLIIPKVLAQNSGMDQQETLVKLQEEYRSAGQPVGLDISTGMVGCTSDTMLNVNVALKY